MVCNLIHPYLASRIQSLSHQLDMSSLCHFHKYFDDNFSDNLPSWYHWRNESKCTTRQSIRSHLFNVELQRYKHSIFNNVLFLVLPIWSTHTYLLQCNLQFTNIKMQQRSAPSKVLKTVLLLYILAHLLKTFHSISHPVNRLRRSCLISLLMVKWFKNCSSFIFVYIKLISCNIFLMTFFKCEFAFSYKQYGAWNTYILSLILYITMCLMIK